MKFNFPPFPQQMDSSYFVGGAPTSYIVDIVKNFQNDLWLKTFGKLLEAQPKTVVLQLDYDPPTLSWPPNKEQAEKYRNAAIKEISEKKEDPAVDRLHLVFSIASPRRTMNTWPPQMMTHAVAVMIDKPSRTIRVHDSYAGEDKGFEPGTVTFRPDIIEMFQGLFPGFKVEKNETIRQQNKGELGCNLWAGINHLAWITGQELPVRENIDLHPLKEFLGRLEQAQNATTKERLHKINTQALAQLDKEYALTDEQRATLATKITVLSKTFCQGIPDKVAPRDLHMPEYTGKEEALAGNVVAALKETGVITAAPPSSPRKHAESVKPAALVDTNKNPEQSAEILGKIAKLPAGQSQGR